MNYLEFGGQYVPQQLKEKLNEIKSEFEQAISSSEFVEEYRDCLKQFVGRPSPLFFARNMRVEQKYI